MHLSTVDVLFVEVNSRDRRSANDAQTLTFFSGYDRNWRLTKLLSLGLVLGAREELKALLAEAGYGEGLDDYVYQQATNGLICSALSEAVMSCEDLFALLLFIREPERFVQKVTRYAAGRIPVTARQMLAADDAAIRAGFLVPSEEYVSSLPGASSRDRALIETGCERLVSMTREVATFYREKLFFHEQYKHGLKLPLAPFAPTLPHQRIEERKQDLFGTVVAYDNEKIDSAFRTGRFDTSALVIPGLSAATQPFLTDLQKEGNLLRYHMLGEVRIDQLAEIARKCSQLANCLIQNRLDFIAPKHLGANTFILPTSRWNRTVQVRLQPLEAPLSLDRFPRKFPI